MSNLKEVYRGKWRASVGSGWTDQEFAATEALGFAKSLVLTEGLLVSGAHCACGSYVKGDLAISFVQCLEDDGLVYFHSLTVVSGHDVVLHYMDGPRGTSSTEQRCYVVHTYKPGPWEEVISEAYFAPNGGSDRENCLAIQNCDGGGNAKSPHPRDGSRLRKGGRNV